MRIMVGAAVAAMMLAGVALAQTEGETAQPPAVVAQTQCPAADPAPSPPDGATADVETVNAYNSAYQTWGEGLRAALQCRQAEIRQLDAERESLVAQHNELARVLNATTEAWRVESEEFCARRGSRCEQPVSE